MLLHAVNWEEFQIDPLPDGLIQMSGNIVVEIRNGEREAGVEIGAAIGEQRIGIPLRTEGAALIAGGRTADLYVPFFVNRDVRRIDVRAVGTLEAREFDIDIIRGLRGFNHHLKRAIFVARALHRGGALSRVPHLVACPWVSGGIVAVYVRTAFEQFAGDRTDTYTVARGPDAHRS